ncbi:hypothetical protein FGO68_gene9340 [Halteria grandinella]|uniref:Uncharacterized protein n=1 Tax=Halteria grandinella TaxID=5974 RepID=A0A8J8NSY5_HALGN|nr:hypothetical protein FGO68_gene9340 [Halteria grandinella]
MKQALELANKQVQKKIELAIEYVISKLAQKLSNQIVTNSIEEWLNIQNQYGQQPQHSIKVEIHHSEQINEDEKNEVHEIRIPQLNENQNDLLFQRLNDSSALQHRFINRRNQILEEDIDVEEGMPYEEPLILLNYNRYQVNQNQERQAQPYRGFFGAIWAYLRAFFTRIIFFFLCQHVRY